MKKVMQFIVVLFFVVLVIFLIDYIKSNQYQNKFEEIKINTHLKTIVNDWGSPNSDFIYEDLNNSIIYKYEKDFLGWNTYIFIFNPKDSLLIRKHIDD